MGNSNKPILFGGAMVRAILGGRKTQTRRIDGLQKLNDSYYRDRINKIEPRDGWCFWQEGHGSSALPVFQAKCPYGNEGDRLWVRETWGWSTFASCREPSPTYPQWVIYRATDDPDESSRWRPSIHMPRWASRITLEITEVRVERLQEISPEDAIAEGIEINGEYNPRDLTGMWKNYDESESSQYWNSPVDSFHSLWTSIHGHGSWKSNPYVWAISFKRVQ